MEPEHKEQNTSISEPISFVADEPAKKIRKKRNAKIDPYSKVMKYVVARKRGYNKNEARDVAGYSPKTTSVTIEQTDAFKKISVRDELLKHISIEEITKAHADVIRQEGDLGARNTALKMAYERVEPEINDTIEEKVVIIMRPDNKE